MTHNCPIAKALSLLAAQFLLYFEHQSSPKCSSPLCPWKDTFRLHTNRKSGKNPSLNSLQIIYSSSYLTVAQQILQIGICASKHQSVWFSCRLSQVYENVNMVHKIEALLQGLWNHQKKDAVVTIHLDA